tara:strand:- start:151 stop:939 length:789 start_codon:yes stop_codon:yes gene_type:complete
MTYIKLHVLKKEATDQFQENLKTIYKYKNQIDENERKRLFTEIKPNDPNHCEIISDFELDQSTTFSNRFEFGKYLYKDLGEFLKDKNERKKYSNNPHFWSWIVLVYIEQLSNKFKQSNRPDRYIPAMGDYKIYGSHNTAHRHMARESYRLYERFGEESKIYFNKKKLFETGNIIESIRSRQDTSNHDGIHKYLLLKYKDKDGYAIPKAAEPEKWKNRDIEKITGRESTVRLAKIYRRLNINYVGPLLNAFEIGEKVGPGFEL